MEQAIEHLRFSLQDVESEIREHEKKLADSEFPDAEKGVARTIIGRLNSKASDFQNAIDTLTDVQKTIDRA